MQVFLDVDYTFDPAWSASVTFSYSDIHQRIGATDFSERETGIGDTLLSAHWTAYDSLPDGPMEADPAWIRSDPRLRLKLDGGVTLPTGDVRMPIENPGATPFSALQLGTGTFNPLLGANFRADWGGLAASLDARWLLPFYENRHDFQAGTYQLYSVAGEVVPIPAVRFALGLEFEHRGQDKIDGDTIPVGGGWRYLLHPQAVINPVDNVNLFLGASIPVYRSFKDAQIDSDVRWELGVQLFF